VAIKIIDKKQMALKAAKAKKAAEEREKRKRAEEMKKGGGGNRIAPQPNQVSDPRGEIDHAKGSNTNDVKKDENGPAPSFISSMQLEVQLLMRLEHPNIINLYQIMESDDECYVVM
jgi:serine/threonine protein kinase